VRRLVLLAVLALPACDTTGLTPSLSPSAQLSAKKAETSAEIAFGLVEQAYEAGRPYLDAHPAVKAVAKGYVAQGLEALHAARAAETIGDTATITAKLAAIESIKDQVAALAKGTGQ
jgi:hypothetical protein